MSKYPHVLIALTILNGAFALVSVSQSQLARAATDTVPVLRGRMLEIVDDKGRVRASIKVHPADPRARMPDGRAEEDTAVLRIITPEGKPGVKIAASENSAGMSLVAEQGNYLVMTSDGVKLTKERQQRAVWP